MRRLVLGFLLGIMISLPAAAQLQYFGYHASGEDDVSLDQVKSYSNLSYISTSDDVYDTRVPSRVNAMAQRGMKAVIELGKVLWCDYDQSGFYRTLCVDWQQRWTNWKSYNTSILTPAKVLALVVRDEPFNWNVSIEDVDAAAKKIKEDLAVSHPTVKIWLLEAACVVAGEPCGMNPGSGAFDRYQGTLPHIDEIGLNAYSIHPETDPTYQFALSKIQTKFPSKKRIYNMDAWWTGSHQNAFGNIEAMGQIAQEWYRVAQSDPQAVALGVTSWMNLEGGLGSRSFPCSVLQEHIAIGRAITGKVRPQTALPVGRLEGISHGTGAVNGWACDPDGALCEIPSFELYVDGGYQITAYSPSRFESSLCSTGVVYLFQARLPDGDSGHRITAYARDLDAGGTTLPSNCPENPACIFYTTNYAPKGYMDGISPTGVATGWVCDRDAPQVSSQALLVTSNGTQIGVYTANQSNEQAVANACGSGYQHRFSVQLPSWTRGVPIYAYSQDLVSGKVKIPWLCSQGSYCIW